MQASTYNKATAEPKGGGSDACELMPSLRRPNYFYGRLLGPREFRGEQDFFREKLRLHTRCLHGYGVVCGLEVTPPERKPDCPPPEDEERKKLEARLKALDQKLAAATTDDEKKAIEMEIEEIRRALGSTPSSAEERPGEAGVVEIACGYAIDCHGNDLVLDRPRRIKLWGALSEADRARWGASNKTVYVALCYCEKPEEPQRPTVFDDCGVTAQCQYGWTRETVRISVFLAGDRPPSDDERCEPCCAGCGCEDADPCEERPGEPPCGCLLLARIVDFDPQQPLSAAQIHNWIRRPLTTYVTTKIDGISWVHGATYSKAQLEQMLPPVDPTRGLVVHFTRPVHRSTITRGVVDLWRIEGGTGAHADLESLDVVLTALPENSEMVDVLVIRNATDETVDYGDRLLIQVRTNFILDACCRAVDGEHIGGRVPVLPDFVEEHKEQIEEARKHAVCVEQPFPRGPWRTGNQLYGGDFVSWVYCEERQPGKRPSQAY